MVALPDRHELQGMLAPVGGDATQRATERAERRLAAWAEDDVDSVPARIVAEGVPLVRTLIE
jgi:hypothetical protein